MYNVSKILFEGMIANCKLKFILFKFKVTDLVADLPVPCDDDDEYS